MRGQARRVRVAVLAAGGVATGLVLAGCSLPDGVDGKLTDSWAAMAEPVGFVPAVGTCHLTEYQESGTLAEYEPVSCDEPHVTEVVHVGEFTDTGGDRVTPPAAGSEEWRSAFGECEEGASEYLGADFRYARLWLGVVLPSTQAWEGGSRWFRCDVVEFEDRIEFDRTRSGTLAGALGDDSAGLRLGCFEVVLTDDDEGIRRMDPVDCEAEHHAEFVGIWRAPADGGYLDGDAQESVDEVHAGCREVVAEYVDLPVDDDLAFRTGTIADWMDEADWDNGDHGFRCYLWLNGEDIEGSLRDAGTDGMPVR